MQENWYFLEELEATDSADISAKVIVPADSPWFSGHFPDNPVLPAVAQLAIVFDVIELGSGRERVLKTIQRTKYRRIIRPAESIRITASQTDEQGLRYAFQMRVDNETACKGTLQMKNP